MEKKENFCIVHDTKTTQILIDPDIDHDEKVHKIHIKFWSNGMNGFVTATPSWSFDHTSDYEGMFDKLKDIEYAATFCNGLLATIGLESEIQLTTK